MHEAEMMIEAYLEWLNSSPETKVPFTSEDIDREQSTIFMDQRFLRGTILEDRMIRMTAVMDDDAPPAVLTAWFESNQLDEFDEDSKDELRFMLQEFDTQKSVVVNNGKVVNLGE